MYLSSDCTLHHPPDQDKAPALLAPWPVRGSASVAWVRSLSTPPIGGRSTHRHLISRPPSKCSGCIRHTHRYDPHTTSLREPSAQDSCPVDVSTLHRVSTTGNTRRPTQVHDPCSHSTRTRPSHRAHRCTQSQMAHLFDLLTCQASMSRSPWVSSPHPSHEPFLH